MSMISEQVKRLREKAKLFSESDFAVDGIVKDYNDAADIIEELSKKLAAGDGGWISVGERMPNKEEWLKDDGRFIVTDGNRRYQSIYDIYEGNFRTIVLLTNGGIERGWNFEVDNSVIAWQPFPPDYQPKGE